MLSSTVNSFRTGLSSTELMKVTVQNVRKPWDKRNPLSHNPNWAVKWQRWAVYFVTHKGLHTSALTHQITNVTFHIITSVLPLLTLLSSTWQIQARRSTAHSSSQSLTIWLSVHGRCGIFNTPSVFYYIIFLIIFI